MIFINNIILVKEIKNQKNKNFLLIHLVIDKINVIFLVEKNFSITFKVNIVNIIFYIAGLVLNFEVNVENLREVKGFLVHISV